MKDRKFIEKCIKKAWKEVILEYYCQQQINSERSLQAYFASKLDTLLKEEKRRIFIEPNIKGFDVSPDIIICNTREIIGVIELKYKPKLSIKEGDFSNAFKKDFETLKLISKQRNKISVKNFRYKGITRDDKVYPMSNKVLFVWAGVYSASEKYLDSQHMKKKNSLNHCYMELHTITQEDKDPETKVRHNFNGVVSAMKKL